MKSELDFVYLVGDLGYGGQERQLYYLATQLKKNVKNIAIIPWHSNPEDPFYKLFLNEKIEIFDLSEYNNPFKKIVAIRKFIKKRKVKILHSYSFHLNFAVAVSVLFTKCKCIGGIRNRLKLYRNDMSFLHFFVSCFSPGIQISNNIKFAESSIWKGLNNLLIKTYFIPNALKINSFTVKNNNSTSSFNTVSVGRLYSEKRVDLIIDVVYQLKKNGVPILHKHAGEGPLKEMLLSKISSLQLNGEFILSGNCDDINNFIGQSHVFIHTSDYEGYPNVIMEAMACGKPVVSTDCGDVEFIIKNTVNGFIVPKNDRNSIYEKVNYLYHNPDVSEKMGIENRIKAEANFSMENHTQQILKIYSNILN